MSAVSFHPARSIPWFTGVLPRSRQASQKRASPSTFRASQSLKSNKLIKLYREAKEELRQKRAARLADSILLGISAPVLGVAGYFAVNFLFFRAFSWLELGSVLGIAGVVGFFIRPLVDFLGRKNTALFRLKAEFSRADYRKLIRPLMDLENKINEGSKNLGEWAEKPSPSMQEELDQLVQKFDLQNHRQWLEEWYRDYLGGRIRLLHALQEAIDFFLEQFSSMTPVQRQQKITGIAQGIGQYSTVHITETFHNDGRSYLFLRKLGIVDRLGPAT